MLKRIVCQLPTKLKVKQFDGKHLLDGMQLKYGWDDIELYGIPASNFVKLPACCGYPSVSGLILVRGGDYIVYLDNGKMTAYPEEVVKRYYLEVL